MRKKIAELSQKIEPKRQKGRKKGKDRKNSSRFG